MHGMSVYKCFNRAYLDHTFYKKVYKGKCFNTPGNYSHIQADFVKTDILMYLPYVPRVKGLNIMYIT